MKMPNSANEGMVRKVEVIASATFAARSLRNTSTPSETPITTSMANDMATTMAWPMASSTTWSQLRDKYSRKLLILPTASPSGVQPRKYSTTIHRLSLIERCAYCTERHSISGHSGGIARTGGPAEQGGELIRGLLDLPSRALKPPTETELGRRDVERGNELSLEVPDRRRSTDQTKLELLIY